MCRLHRHEHDEEHQSLVVPWVYLLRCADDSFYVGSARDLEQRLAEHAAGTVKGFTARHRPVELVWALETERMDDAAELERQIKG